MGYGVNGLMGYRVKGESLFDEDGVPDVVDDDDDDGNDVEAFHQHVINEGGEVGLVIRGKQEQEQ